MFNALILCVELCINTFTSLLADGIPLPQSLYGILNSAIHDFFNEASWNAQQKLNVARSAVAP